MALRHYVLSVRYGETYSLVADGADLAMEGGEVTLDVVPAPPLDAGTITATAGDGTVQIAEGTAPSGGSGAYTRDLYRSTTSGQKGSALALDVSLPYDDDTPENGTTYYYTLEVDDGEDTDDTPQVSATPEAAGDVEPLFVDDFEQYATGAWSGDSEAPVVWGGGSERVIITDVLARSGTKSVAFRWSYPGSVSNTVELNLRHPQVQEYWAEFYMYFPDGSEGFSSAYTHRNTGRPSYNNKFWAFWADSYTSEPSGAFQLWPIGGSGSSRMDVSATRGNQDGDLNLWIYPDSDPNADPPQIQDGVAVDVTEDLGRWIRFRIHMKLAPEGTSDCVMRCWRDNDLLVQITDWHLYDEARQHSYLEHAYILGAANSGFADETWILMDDFKFWTTDPGWEG